MRKSTRNKIEVLCIAAMAISIMVDVNIVIGIVAGLIWFLDVVEPSYHRMPLVRVGLTVLVWNNPITGPFAIGWYIIHAMGRYQTRSVERLRNELKESNGKLKIRRELPGIGIPRLFFFLELDREAEVFRKRSSFGTSDPQKWRRVEDAEFPGIPKILGYGRIEFDSKKVHKDNEVRINGIPYPAIVLMDEQYEGS